jgi:hypothetical protein
MKLEKCFQMTVEGPGELFQIVRDTLDTKRLIQSEIFFPAEEGKANSYTTSAQIQKLIGQFNLQKVLEVSQKLKITHAQASRIFDTLLLYLVNTSDHSLMTAFKGYFRLSFTGK